MVAWGMTTTPFSGPALDDRPLTLDATHRCDACGAQAQVVVMMRSGGELLFCGHHFARHREPLESGAACIVDSRAAGGEDDG